MNIYLKLFLGAGIPFGIFMSIFFSILNGLERGLTVGLFGGLFFGFFMSVILGTIHQMSIKKSKSNNAKNNRGVRHFRTVEVDLPFEKAFDLCIKSLQTIKKSEVLCKDRSNGTIDAQAGMTWKTFGDEIKFILKAINKKSTVIEISSRPKVRTTLVDYGKNF